jgi:hypothetical protein
MQALIMVMVLPVLVVALGCRHAPVEATLLGPAKHVDGLTEQKLVSRFGVPKTIKEFPMSEARSVYRVKLQTHYPLPKCGAVRIRELTWELPNDGLLTVWTHQSGKAWRAFESTTYTKWTIF